MNSPIFPFAPKRIVCAALRNPAGQIVTGARHHHCWDATKTHTGDWTDTEHIVDGFVDQDGEFYTRHEAYQLACERGQIEAKAGDTPILSSEELY